MPSESRILAEGSQFIKDTAVSVAAQQRDSIHPTHRPRQGAIELASLWGLLTNPWVFPQYLHTMLGSAVTASFVVASIGAYYTLRGEHPDAARRFMSVAVVSGLIAVLLRVYSDRKPEDILSTKPQFIKAIGFDEHLSPTRSNGLASMLQAIRTFAGNALQL